MIHGTKLELIEKLNIIGKLARNGDPELTDQICNFLTENFELQASVLFKIVNDNTLVVYGRSVNAKKNFLKGATFNLELSTIFDKTQSFSITTDTISDLQISEFVIYECGIVFQVSENQKVFLKIAKETPFAKNDFDSLKHITEFISHYLAQWVIAQGGDIIVTEKPLNQTIYEIAQELRTPANTIIGFTSILSEDNLSSSQIDSANTIKMNASSLLANINDLVEYAKLEASKLEISKKETEIRTLLTELIENLRSKSDQNILKYDLSVDSSVPKTLIVDEQKLRFILNTLLTFSRSLTMQGEIKIDVKIDKSNMLRFQISDNGKGVPAEVQRSIFVPFIIKKVDELKKSNLSGLSLPLSKKLVNFLGGELSIDSIAGQGTKTFFSVGINGIDGQKTEKVKTKATSITSLPKPNSKTNKILVIEDDYASSKLLSNYLNKWGYDPTIVNTEEQTLSLISKEHFLAVIMDIAIPNTNGLELLKKIHSHQNTKNTPVIVCSIEAEQQKAFMMGAVEYFQKPINYNYLVEVLTSYKLRKNSNILCVDDDLPTLNLVKQAIETAGFNAIEENVSANVMELISDKDIDLAILDLDMPTPNGFELIKMIKSEPKFANLPIIIYTGKDNFQHDLSKIEGLFDELLDKRSVNIEDLAETINSMVNRIETPPTVEEVIEKKDVIKILFAEDYKHSQIIVTRLLKKNSFENVAVVENGKEAFDLAKKENFDLILMDMQMPIMNGFEATENIRKMPQYKDIPIIALTAFAMKGDREKCLDAGATDYIPKPIDSKEFIEKVRYYTNTLK